MNSISKFLAATVISGLASVATLGSAQAADAITMKPLHGISFDVGTKRAVSYFQNDNGVCKLTLLVAEPFAETSTRVEQLIDAGTSLRLDAVEGRPLEFSCQAHAGQMSVTQTVLVTSN